MEYKDIEEDIIKKLSKRKSYLSKLFFIENTQTLKSLDQINKDLIIDEYIHIISSDFCNKSENFFNPEFFEKFLEYYNIHNDNIPTLRKIFILINKADIIEISKIFFSNYQNFIINNIEFIVIHIFEHLRVNTLKTLLSDCSEDNYNIVKEEILFSPYSKKIFKNDFNINFYYREVTDRRPDEITYLHLRRREYMYIIHLMLLYEKKIFDLNRRSKEFDIILNCLIKIFTFDNFEGLCHYDLFVCVKNTIKDFFELSFTKIKNSIIVKNLINIGCDITHMDVCIEDNENFKCIFEKDPSFTEETILIKKRISNNINWNDLLSLNSNNIHPNLQKIWNQFWMIKGINDFKDKDIDSILWKDYIENKENISYKKRYKILEDDIYYRSGGECSIEACHHFNK